MPLRVRNKSNNASTFFAPHGSNTSQFAAPTAGEAGIWLPTNVDLINGTQAVASALGVGNARTTTFRNNITDTGTPLVLAHPDISMRGLIGGTLVPADDSGFADSNYGRQLDTGTPPFEASRIAFFYRDQTDEQLCWHGFGSPTFNQSVTGTPEFFGIDQNRTTTTEAVARMIAPAPCHIKRVTCRGGNAALTDHRLSIVINGGAPITIGTLTGAAAWYYDFIVDIALLALDEFSFRVERVAGASATLSLLAVVAFKPDTP